MTYYNNGTFETEDEETMKELLRIIDEVGLGTATCGEADQYRLDDKFYLELTDCIGDIEVSLKEIVDVCEKADLKISFLITYCGDAEGAYSYLNGVYETLGEEELHLRNVSNESLFAEIARRGLFQSAEIMRTDYNCGSFEAESEEDLKKLIRVINEIGLGTARYSENDIDNCDGKCRLKVSGCIGNLEESLANITEVCKKAGLKISFYISYCGEAEGAYSYQNGIYKEIAAY